MIYGMPPSFSPKSTAIKKKHKQYYYSVNPRPPPLVDNGKTAILSMARHIFHPQSSFKLVELFQRLELEKPGNNSEAS